MKASFYRALMKFVCPAIRDWDVAKGKFWDSTLAGNSSLRAAVERALKVDNGVARGAQVGNLRWDMKEFYDSVQLPILCEALLKHDYPPELMVLGFFAHTAPRILKVGTCLGPVVNSCGRSMLAGDQQSVSWARALLNDLMEKLSVADPEFPCSSHVDDLSHVLIGESKAYLKGKLIKAGKLVGAETKRLQLELSEKSTLLPSNQNTRTVVTILLEEGVQIKTGETCDDVGVQMTGSGNRRASTLNKRIDVSAANRAKRTRGLVKINPAATKLTMPGTNAVHAYGHQAQGVSGIQMTNLNTF